MIGILDRNKTVPMPATLDIPVGGECNLRCFMCGIGANPEKYKISLTDAAYRHTYELFPYLSRVELNGAEIFAQPENTGARVDELIGRAKEFPQLKLNGATNGMLMGEGRVKAIVEKFAEISFSVDSCRPEIYESIRLGADFRTLEENLTRICQLKDKLGLKPTDPPQLHFSAIVMDRTFRELPELVDFIGRMGGVFLALRPINKDVDDEQWNKILPEDIFNDKIKIVEYMSIVSRAKSLAGKLGIKIADATFSAIRHRFPELLEQEVSPPCKKGGGVGEAPLCPLAWKSLYINSRGLALFGPCSRRILGDLNQCSAMDIWNSRAAREERKNLAKGNHEYCILSRCIV